MAYGYSVSNGQAVCGRDTMANGYFRITVQATMTYGRLFVPGGTPLLFLFSFLCFPDIRWHTSGYVIRAARSVLFLSLFRACPGGSGFPDGSYSAGRQVGWQHSFGFSSCFSLSFSCYIRMFIFIRAAVMSYGRYRITE